MTQTILDTIGNTPLIEIRKLNPNPKVRIVAKLEYFNPGGSIKDRPALRMIEEGERSGALHPGKTVIEATSGNTGIGLALVCSVKGYKLLLTMSEAVSIERQKILKARGAEILLTPGHLGTDGAIEEVYRLARENPDTYFMADQYNNPANWMAHYDGTAAEVWKQTEGRMTMLVATMGTSGTLMGMSRRLKEFNPDIRIIGVEPYLGHKIQGLKNMKEAYQPGIFDKRLLDVKINIDDEEAFEMTRRLAREEGMFVGMSSGAAMAIACRQAMEMDSGMIVVIFPDSGERYLSTSLFSIREKIDMTLCNAATRRKEGFLPAAPNKVGIFTSGPTVYRSIDISECRRFVVSDLLRRYLEARGYAVTHVVNVTDLDDKTIDGSLATGEPLDRFTARYEEVFLKDLSFLGIKPAEVYARASEHIEEMIQAAEKLAQKGYAYEKLHSLYFDISRYADYGRFSGVDLDKIRPGATVDLEEYEKDNPRDFTLFKRARLSDLKRGIYIKTPWGNVRPSWHLQGVTMALKYLGPGFDIYVGARELAFPHHENEMAIAVALSGKPLTRYWLHCDGVRPSQAEADHPANADPLFLGHLTEMGFQAREIRFWLLSTHYRKPLVFSPDRLEYARTALKRIQACIHALQTVSADGRCHGDCDQLVYDLKNDFYRALDDDLNIAEALASLFRHVKSINRLVLQHGIDRDAAERLLQVLKHIDGILGVLHFDDAALDPEIAALIERRRRARDQKDWETADRIRNELAGRGVIVRDEKCNA
ncbi:cysteine synthase [Desulfatirhabdium butyrativorans]|uniref:cysteine synthase n=1 Tax=Desulfatirhabdium butyrativorans TaxID=340467 RepID=UPI000402527B|nr:cysteine synthase [Desulfatirhabdium butyrativorans]